MDAAFERVLIESLEALEVGESLDSVLARHPQYAAELRLLLETASTLSQVKVAHSLAAQAESRQRFLDRAVALQNEANKPTLTALLFRRLTLTFVPLIMVLFILAASVIYASFDTVPGDYLYDTKRAVEDIRLSLTTNPFAQDQLRENLQKERIHEIEQLLASGRQAEVSFSGIIEALGDDEWVVAGLRLVIDESTSVEGTPMVGRFVWVEAKTINGRLIAQTITTQFVPDQLPEIEPTPRIRRLQNPEQLDQEIVIPTATNTPTSTATAEPTATVPAPADEPVIVPTKTPAPTEDSNGGEGNKNDDDGNEDDSDNDNENDGENDGENENDDDNENDGGNENDGDNENDGGHENDNDNENDDDKNENDKKNKSS
jgi:hypothetical protein